VSIALFLLSLLAVAAPVSLAFDTEVAGLCLMLWTALLLGIAGIALRPPETANVWKTIRALLPLALIPAVWMIAQLLPAPYLAHPIWQSAATALDIPLHGKISADPGLTLQALLRYMSLLGVMLAALCVAIDRSRAHRLLCVLVVVAGFAAIAFIVVAAGGLRTVEAQNLSTAAASFATIGNLGMLLSASLIVSALDQYLLRRSGSGIGGSVLAEFCAGGVVFAICLGATAFAAPRLIVIAGLCGLIPVFLVAFFRHAPSHGWEKGLVTAVIMIVAVAAVLSGFDKGSGDLAFRAAAGATPVQTALAGRMLADAGPLGTGAGTYAALLPVYRGIGDFAVLAPPSAAAKISLELGRSGLAAVLALGAILSAILFRRALARGRDSLYAAAGSGCVVLLMLEMFADAGAMTTGASVLAATTIGLALGQSVSLPRG
jgi:hypothetical protein